MENAFQLYLHTPLTSRRSNPTTPLSPKSTLSSSTTPTDLYQTRDDDIFNIVDTKHNRRMSNDTSGGTSEAAHIPPHVQQYLQFMKHDVKLLNDNISKLQSGATDVLYFIIHSIDKGTCWFVQSYEKVEVDEIDTEIPTAHNKQVISQIISSVQEDWKSQNSFTVPLGEEFSSNSGYLQRTINNESHTIMWKIPPKCSFCYSLVCTMRCNMSYAEYILNHLINHTAFSKKDVNTPIDPREFLFKPEEMLSKLHHVMPHGKLVFLNFTKNSFQNMFNYLPDFVL